MIFADTSFWVALQLPRDERHDQAVTLLKAHGERGLVTSNHVRGETWTLQRSPGRRIATPLRFLDQLERSTRLGVLFVSEQLEEEALRWLRRHDERAYSFVDATSFALMRSLKIHDALGIRRRLLRRRLHRAPAELSAVGPWRIVIISAVHPVVEQLVPYLRELGHEPVGWLLPRRDRDDERPLPPWGEVTDSVAPDGSASSSRRTSGRSRPCCAGRARRRACAGFPWKLPQEALDVARLGAVNQHPGKLPRTAGRRGLGVSRRGR